MSFSGLIIGAFSFLIIGILHPVVIIAEFHLGKKCWPLFAVGGLIACVLSLIVSNQIASILLAILGFSLFWSIHEIFEQEKRVARGWYPCNPKRQAQKPTSDA